VKSKGRGPARRAPGKGRPSIARIRKLLRECLPELRQRYAVRSLGVFGSFARDEQGPRSDLDILVDFCETPTFFQFVEIEHDLSERLGLKIDLVMKSALKPKIGEHILAEVIPV